MIIKILAMTFILTVIQNEILNKSIITIIRLYTYKENLELLINYFHLNFHKNVYNRQLYNL